jgi:hypothetical protein
MPRFPTDLNANAVDLSQYRQPRSHADTMLLAPPDMDQIATNVRNLAGAMFWRVQGCAQRGDQAGASRAHVARARVIAEARREGIDV